MKYDYPNDAKALKDLFDQCFTESRKTFDIDSYFDGSLDEDLPVLPSDFDVAQVMMEAKVCYWDHYGWLEACKTAIHMLVYSEALSPAQAYSSWLLADAPKGVVELNQELVDYSTGNFPTESIEKRKQITERLGERMKANRSGEYTPNPVPIWKRLETELA